MEKLNFSFPNKQDIKRLSELDPNWRSKKNVFGDLPQIDYACCRPFKCLDKDSIEAIKSVINSYRHEAYSNKRAITLRGIPKLQSWFSSSELEKVVSNLVGVDLIASPLTLEHAHVNLQTASEDHFADTRVAVDDWHYDYVPFVFITMISKSENGQGGRLCTEFGDFDLKEGESILVQGSHVKHMAEKANDGNRITLITSFSPKSLDFTDMTQVFPHELPYAPSESLYDQALALRFSRLARQSARIASCDPVRDRNELKHYLACMEDDSFRLNKLLDAGEEIQANNLPSEVGILTNQFDATQEIAL